MALSMELSRPRELAVSHSQEATHVNRLALLALAAAALLATAGGASAQIFYYGPGYGPHIEPRYERDYDGRRYRRDDRRYYRSAQRCPRGFTVQDGVCKPYRGY